MPSATQLVKLTLKIGIRLQNQHLLKCCFTTLGLRVGSMKGREGGWGWRGRKGLGHAWLESMQRHSDLLQGTEERVEMRSPKQVRGPCRASEGAGISVKEFEGPGRLNSGKTQVIEVIGDEKAMIKGLRPQMCIFQLRRGKKSGRPSGFLDQLRLTGPCPSLSLRFLFCSMQVENIPGS